MSVKDIETQTEEVKETVTPDPSSETTKTEVAEEKPLPFHEHPRFKEIIEEKNALANQVREMASKLDGLSQVQKPKADVPEWFAEAFGDNAALYQKYESWDSSRRAALKKEALDEVMSQQSKAQEAAKKWTDYVEGSVERLKADGKKFDKNELLAIAEEYLPTNEKGDIDFDKAYAIYELKKQTGTAPNPSKEVAAKTDADKSGGAGSGKAKTWQDFKGKSPW